VILGNDERISGVLVASLNIAAAELHVSKIERSERNLNDQKLEHIQK
jgi:hypothetical protein